MQSGTRSGGADAATPNLRVSTSNSAASQAPVAQRGTMQVKLLAGFVDGELPTAAKLPDQIPESHRFLPAIRYAHECMTKMQSEYEDAAKEHEKIAQTIEDANTEACDRIAQAYAEIFTPILQLEKQKTEAERQRSPTEASDDSPTQAVLRRTSSLSTKSIKSFSSGVSGKVKGTKIFAGGRSQKRDSQQYSPKNLATDSISVIQEQMERRELTAQTQFTHLVTSRILPERNERIAQEVWTTLSESASAGQLSQGLSLIYECLPEAMRPMFGDVARYLTMLTTRHDEAKKRVADAHAGLAKFASTITSEIGYQLSVIQSAESAKQVHDRVMKRLPPEKENLIAESENRIHKEAESLLRHAYKDDELARMGPLVAALAPKAAQLFKDILSEKNGVEERLDEIADLSDDEKSKIDIVCRFASERGANLVKLAEKLVADPGISFEKAKAELHREVGRFHQDLGAKVEENLRKRYGKEIPDGDAYGLLLHIDRKTAESFHDVSAFLAESEKNLANLKGGFQASLQKKRLAQDDDAIEFGESLRTLHESLIVDIKIALGKGSAVEINKEIQSKLGRLEKKIDDLGAIFLGNTGDSKDVLTSPKFRLVAEFAPHAAEEFKQDIEHKRKQTGPYLFSQPEENAPHAQERRKLVKFYQQDWKKYADLFKLEGKPAHNLKDLYILARSSVKGFNSAAADWEANGGSGELRLILGAMAAVLGQVFLDQPDADAQSAQAQSGIKQPYESERKNFEEQIKNYREALNGLTSPIMQEEIAKFCELQTKRARDTGWKAARNPLA